MKKILWFLITSTSLLHAQISAGSHVGRPCDGKDDQPCTRAPRVIYAPEPEYSDTARKAKREGACILQVTVGIDGRPRDIKVLVHLGMGLDEKAIEAAQHWRFQPGEREGKPIAAKVALEVRFHLNRG